MDAKQNGSTPLIRCPHCKGEADVYRKIHPIEHDWSVCCKTCWAGTAEYPTEAEARAAWARRDELDTLAAQVQRAVDEASRQADQALAAEAEAAVLQEALEGLVRHATPVAETCGNTTPEEVQFLAALGLASFALARASSLRSLETALRLAREAQPDTRKWQPIETAPRKTEILLAWHDGTKWHQDTGWVEDWEPDLSPEQMRWMPLPSLPAIRAQQEGK